MNQETFVYSYFCTAFYVPEMAAVMVYDEIEEKEIQTIPAGSEEEAETILTRWLNHSPRGYICETL